MREGTNSSRGTERKADRIAWDVTSVVRIWLSTILVRAASKFIILPSCPDGRGAGVPENRAVVFWLPMRSLSISS
ncbi:hypothetical protein D3C87_1547290 [compost metagenome]